MRSFTGAPGGNSCAQLTMNSSASSSRSFSMKGEGSIELKSWFRLCRFNSIVFEAAGSGGGLPREGKRISCLHWFLGGTARVAHERVTHSLAEHRWLPIG